MDNVILGLMPRIALQLYEAMAWSQVMNVLRDLRRDAGLTQYEFATLIGIPVNTFRMWDSGLRPGCCGGSMDQSWDNTGVVAPMRGRQPRSTA